MGALLNLARMTTATTGTGTITLGSAVSGFITFAAAGAVNGATYSYAIEDGVNREIGEGVYSTTGPTLTRVVTNSTAGGTTAISLSGSAQVFITPRQQDILAKTGDTMLGDLIISKVGPQFILNATAAAQGMYVTGRMNNVPRWMFQMGDASLESGSDVGCDFFLVSFNDTASTNKAVLRGTRNDGLLRVYGDPTVALGIATKQYADTKLSLAGGTMTGAMEVQTPTTTWHPTPKGYVDTAVGGKVAKTGDTMSGNLTFSDVGEGVTFSGGGRIYDQAAATYMQANGDTFSVYNEAGTTPLFVVTPSLVSTNGGLQVATTLAVLGASTFSGTVTVPTPTTSLHAATKGYADGFLHKTGGTMTGDLTITKTYPAFSLNKPTSGEYNIIWGNTNNSARWALRFGDTQAEAGSNSGSDYNLMRYDDAGTYLGGGMHMYRSTGVTTFSHDTIYKPSGGSFTAGSDIRIKTVTGEYKSGLAQLLELRPVRYRYKGNDTKFGPAEDEAELRSHSAPFKTSMHHTAATEGTEYIGLVAQQAELPFPECVSRGTGYIDGEKVDDFRSLDSSPLVYALINAVQELEARVRALEGK